MSTQDQPTPEPPVAEATKTKPTLEEFRAGVDRLANMLNCLQLGGIIAAKGQLLLQSQPDSPETTEAAYHIAKAAGALFRAHDILTGKAPIKRQAKRTNR